MSDNSQFDRIELMLTEVLTYVVRLESRLEHAGMLTGYNKANDAFRFELENALEPDRELREPVSMEYQLQVLHYLNEHENDPKASFYKMEDDFGAQMGHSERIPLMKCLQLFVLRGQFVKLISRMVNTREAPSEAKGLEINPYADELPKGEQ